tara:strand:- start:349 stop:645 length:297 start_codon:yes stop_codon:yes gene_type:complete
VFEQRMVLGDDLPVASTARGLFHVKDWLRAASQRREATIVVTTTDGIGRHSVQDMRHRVLVHDESNEPDCILYMNEVQRRSRVTRQRDTVLEILNPTQ